MQTAVPALLGRLAPPAPMAWPDPPGLGATLGRPVPQEPLARLVLLVLLVLLAPLGPPALLGLPGLTV